MLEGVLKVQIDAQPRICRRVSILGMLEGVLKEALKTPLLGFKNCFNPWYVGGGVKRPLRA